MLLLFSSSVSGVTVKQQSEYFADISQHPTCNARFCPTTEWNIRKIQSYNFSKAETYLQQLEPKGTLEAIYKGPGTSNIEIPVLVGAASSNHYHEVLGLFKNLNEVVRPAYPSIKIFYYDLGLRPEQTSEVTSMLCSILILTVYCPCDS